MRRISWQRHQLGATVAESRFVAPDSRFQSRVISNVEECRVISGCVKPPFRYSGRASPFTVAVYAPSEATVSHASLTRLALDTARRNTAAFAFVAPSPGGDIQAAAPQSAAHGSPVPKPLRTGGRVSPKALRSETSHSYARCRPSRRPAYGTFADSASSTHPESHARVSPAPRSRTTMRYAVCRAPGRGSSILHVNEGVTTSPGETSPFTRSPAADGAHVAATGMAAQIAIAIAYVIRRPPRIFHKARACVRASSAAGRVRRSSPSKTPSQGASRQAQA